MNGKHTPGPLTVRVGANGDVGIVAPAQQAVSAHDIGGALIAECFCEIRRADEGARAEALANATLFAAAEDLLTAATQAARWIQQEMAGKGWPQERIDNPPAGSHLFNLYAAIAKATP